VTNHNHIHTQFVLFTVKHMSNIDQIRIIGSSTKGTAGSHESNHMQTEGQLSAAASAANATPRRHVQLHDANVTALIVLLCRQLVHGVQHILFRVHGSSTQKYACLVKSLTASGPSHCLVSTLCSLAVACQMEHQIHSPVDVITQPDFY